MIPRNLQNTIERLERDPRVRAAYEEVTKQLCAEGHLTEAGWELWNRLVLPPNASEVRRSETRRAFYAGAYHLFTSMMFSLDEEREPTDADIRRVAEIQEELQRFFKESGGN